MVYKGLSMDRGIFSKNASLFFRGIAILMVIFSHYFEWGSAAIGNEGLSSFVASLGDWGVGIFFMLSGYALYKGYRDKPTDRIYIIKRLKNVYIPYFVIALIIAVFSDALHNGADALRLLTGADYWFMITIFIIYAAFYFVGKLPDKYRVFIMTVFIIDMSLWLFIKDFQNFWYTADWAFALGMVLSKYETRFEKAARGCVINIKDFAFCTLGRVSLYIYLLHAAVYFRIVNLPVIQNMGINWYLQMLIALLLTVAAALLAESVFNGIFRFAGSKNKNHNSLREGIL